MTTIACDREQMVSDSRVTTPGGPSYPAVKIIRVKDRIIGACGHNGDCTRFLEWAKKEFKGTEPKWILPASDESAVEGIVLDKDGIYLWNSGDPEPERLLNVEQFAVGSGGCAARVAMILGKSVTEAVELACRVDDNSGMPLQVLKLKE
jgi:hypothetical protein